MGGPARKPRISVVPAAPNAGPRWAEPVPRSGRAGTLPEWRPTAAVSRSVSTERSGAQVGHRRQLAPSKRARARGVRTTQPTPMTTNHQKASTCTSTRCPGSSSFAVAAFSLMTARITSPGSSVAGISRRLDFVRATSPSSFTALPS